MTDTRIAPGLRAARAAFDRIPVIDLAPLTGAGDRARMARDIRWALTHTGFMYVRNHGVGDAREQAAFDAVRALFDLPQADKDAAHIRHSGVAMHGYTGLYGENADPGRTRDYKEIFDLGREAADGQVRPFFGPVPWPRGADGIRPPLIAWHDQMLALARRLVQGIALSLDLPGECFAGAMSEPIGIQRLLHYPSQSRVEDDSIIGIGAHTDYGLLTLLAQDQVGGLQVLSRDRVWIDAPHIPGTLVVNVGDMLQRLTNGLYLANLHRVINVSGAERYSMPFFFDFNFETEVAPLPSLVPVGEEPRYAPVICGAHKWARYVASFPHLAAA